MRETIFFFILAACCLARAVLAAEVPASFIASPPARYQALDSATRDLLARSVLEKKLIVPDSRAFTGATLWDFLDGSFTPALLETVVQLRKAAEDQRLAPYIVTLREVYAGTSWGIKFYGPDALIASRLLGDDFCHDIDSIVRREHGNTPHTWWRHLGTVAGLGSLHLGLSDGAGYHDLHIDTTNPATRRGAFGDASLCDYSMKKVLAHNMDIKSSNPFTSELRQFLELDVLGYFHWRLGSVLAQELASAPTSTHRAWPTLLSLVRAIGQKRAVLVEAATKLANQTDGISRFRAELDGDLEKETTDIGISLRLFIDHLISDGDRVGYFPKTTDRADLIVMSAKVEGDGTLSLSTHDVDW
ncbi:MAG: hypothetical protein HY075_13990, partial [Deltaproteobacteria bacterium]|nr:hypothetical protein [Deltaproteobacteria bacterium]